jgi:hypothetical protein
MELKPLGPTFGDAITAAGLAGLPFSWETDGTLTFHPDMTPDQIAAVEAVYSGYDPNAPPTVQQQAQALLEQPVTVVSTSLPALNGIYPIDDATRGEINGIASAINAGLGLPGGGETFNWADTSGDMHPWPATQFTAFAKEVMNYAYTLGQVAQGHGDTLPSATLKIP